MINQKLSTDLNLLFGSIIKNPSPQTTEELMTFSTRVMNSFIGSQPIQTTQILKEKCLERSRTIYSGDSRTSLKCNELMQKIITSRSLGQKEAALKLIYKISQNQSLSTSNVSLDNAFKSQALKRTQLDITSTSIRQEEYREKQRTLPEKLTIIRSRGSPEQAASESDILRQLVYAMQNIFGNLISSSGGDSHAVLKSYINVSEPVRRITMELGELGWLYKKITTKSMDIGEVRQSFGIAVQSELNEFYRWIAIIESLLRENQLTLRKLVMWSIEPFQRFKWLAILSEAVTPYRGTKIISIINSYRPHGDHFIMELLNRILIHVIQPLFKFVEMWVYRGQLFDPYSEFFIGEDSKMGSQSFWQKKYRLIEQNVPNVMGMQNAKIVFNIGKTINFLKHCCGHEFQIQQMFLHKDSILDTKCSAITFSSQFTEWLNGCSNIVNKQLMKVLFKKFKLKDHLDAIRRFLLMGQGDFIEVLLDTLGQELNKTPTTIYKHNLNNKLEKALASSNAQYLEEDITGRVNVEMLQGSDGWDNFMLTYAVDEPINTLLTPRIMKEGYLGIFGFLWKLKRVERSLNLVWTSHIKQISRKPQQEMLTEAGKKIKKCFQRYDKLFIECSLLRSSMQHFVNSLYSYIILTIEASWNKFIETLETATNFDEVLKLHEQLVMQLRQICFLESKNKNIQAAALALFQQISIFKHKQDALIEEYQNFKEIAREALLSERAIQRLEKLEIKRQISIPYNFNENRTRQFISEGTKRIYENRENFTKILMDFMTMLQKEGEKYSILLFKQDFNQYYRTMPLRRMR